MVISDSYRELLGFSDQKAAEVASYFTARAAGPIDKLKLIKLVYLADRRAMEELGRPMLNDVHYSLKNGPICSEALNGINGERAAQIWSRRIKRDGNSVTLASGARETPFDEVSPRETRIMDAVWDFFGGMTTYQVWQWTHDHCPEYEEVKSGRRPITYERIFAETGSANPEARANQVCHDRAIARAFPA